MQSDGNSFCRDVCRLGQLSQAISGWRQHFRPNIQSKYVRIIKIMTWILYKIIQKMHTNTRAALKTQFSEFLVVMCYVFF